jgi:hypothetical protein
MARCAGQQAWLAESRRSPLVTSKTSFAADLAISFALAAMRFLAPQARSPYRSAIRRLAFYQEKIYTGHRPGAHAGAKAEIAPANQPDPIADRPPPPG